jgi:cation diffusion facilitator CzcD-associated flavoprotein CzcO
MSSPLPTAPVEHVDVLIIGAGLSGISAACHVRERCPGKSITILEGRDAIGGTWDLFRYPGIRSDSDMFTLGYSFRPWTDPKAIADGPAILDYVRDTARDHGVDEAIRFGHRVIRVDWSTEEARWTVTAERDGGETVVMTCGFLLACTGYYRYDEPFTPEFKGTERFGGEIIHPQHWPEDLDYDGKRVVVIGSGATAVTLVPAMAERAQHVTMLQRSPTYIVALPGRDPVADFLRAKLPDRLAYSIVRAKNVITQTIVYRLSRRAPNFVRRMVRKGVERQLPKDFDVDTHFEPRYDPWDQRMCLVPDGDLFAAMRRGDASVVTDHIETFTEKGILLQSGEELEADVIVTATGLNLMVLGGMDIVVDGEALDMPEAVTYKGMMFAGVPNLAYALGYTNASWTLKCDLVAKYACRLINHLDANGYASATPKAPDASVGIEPVLDLSAGYVQRSLHELPKQGSRTPWKLHQNYAKDIVMLRYGPLEDEAMEFAKAGERARTPVSV